MLKYTRQEKIDMIEYTLCLLGPTHEWTDDEIEALFQKAINYTNLENEVNPW